MLNRVATKLFCAQAAVLKLRTASRAPLVSTEFLLSPENRNRCLKCMQRTPGMGMKLVRTHAENRSAAVLIAVCVDSQGQASILYTRRSGTLSRHVKQISFPGGIKDDADVDFVACALRETEEEIGLPRSRVQVWGTGAPLTPPNTAAITPVFGTVEGFRLEELNLNAAEVEEAFTLPLLKLAAPSSQHHTQFKIGYSVPVFIVGNYKIWGITAHITKAFLNCLVPGMASDRVKCIKPYKPQ